MFACKKPGEQILSTYKEKIVKEIRRVPDDKMPKLYRVIHRLTTELMSESKKAFDAFEGTVKRGTVIVPCRSSAEIMFIAKKGRFCLNHIEISKTGFS